VDCLTTDLVGRLGGGLSSGAIIALIALGYTLVYGVLQLINFAHSEIFMIGTLTGFLSTTWLVETFPAMPGLLVLFVALIPSILVAGIAAVLLERIAYRPLRRRGAPRLSYLISAIGASLFIANFVRIWRGSNPESYPQLTEVYDVIEIGRLDFSNVNLIIIGVSIVSMIALDQFVRRSRLGRGIRAVAQDADTASLMGVNPSRVIALTFFLGGAMAGVAGLMFGFNFGRQVFDIGFLPGVKAFTAAVLGGIGSIRGAMLGGLLLGVIENVSAGCFGTEWKDVSAFAILVLVLMFRPTGLLGTGQGQKL
jgi:branched-chain amino acid transport system permease protein